MQIIVRKRQGKQLNIAYQKVNNIEAPVVELFTKDFSEHNGQGLDNGPGAGAKRGDPESQAQFQFKG